MTLIEISQVLGNFGEFFGAILVGVSLFYLAVQVRHNANVTDEANMRAEVERIAGFSKFAAGTPGFMEIFLKAQNGETLMHVERALFNTHMYAMFVTTHPTQRSRFQRALPESLSADCAPDWPCFEDSSKSDNTHGRTQRS